MLSDTDRFLLYYLVCLPLRVGVGVGVLYFPSTRTSSSLVGSVFCIQSLAMATRSFLHTSVSRGGLGGKVWWDPLRPFHYLTFFVSGLLLLSPSSPGNVYGSFQTASGSLLLVDVSVSAISSLFLNKSLRERGRSLLPRRSSKTEEGNKGRKVSRC